MLFRSLAVRRRRLDIFPVLAVFRLRHIGEACHDLGNLLPFGLACDEESVKILLNQSDDIPFGAVAPEESLPRLVTRMAQILFRV